MNAASGWEGGVCAYVLSSEFWELCDSVRVVGLPGEEVKVSLLGEGGEYIVHECSSVAEGMTGWSRKASMIWVCWRCVIK
jgi:hypothetical protein